VSHCDDLQPTIETAENNCIKKSKRRIRKSRSAPSMVVQLYRQYIKTNTEVTPPQEYELLRQGEPKGDGARPSLSLGQRGGGERLSISKKPRLGDAQRGESGSQCKVRRRAEMRWPRVRFTRDHSFKVPTLQLGNWQKNAERDKIEKKRAKG